MSKLVLGVVGASNIIAKELVEWMSKWHVDNVDVHFYDTKEHVGYVKCCCDHFMPIQEVKKDVITELDILIFCDETLRKVYSKFISPHSYAINLCAYEDKERIVIPHINCSQLQKREHHFYIAHASLFMLASMLYIAQKKLQIQTVDITSFHSVAECGDIGCKDLQDQIQAYASKQDLESKQFPLGTSFQHLPLLFQAIPQTTPFIENGKTIEEATLAKQVSLFCNGFSSIHATCVRIAALRGLAMSITMHLKDSFILDEIVDAYASSPSYICIDDIQHDMYPICGDVIHDYRMYIGRMRKSGTTCFQAWTVCDDLSIRCAAAVQLVLYIVHNFY